MKFFVFKCLQGLQQWYWSSPGINQVWEWYQSWRILIPQALIGNESVRHQLWMGLIVMGRAVDGLEIMQPEQELLN